jgi:hypothetical protein
VSPIDRIASLLQERNALDRSIAGLIDRPMTAGHLGEWIAARIFDIELEPSAVAAAIDGRFRSGPLVTAHRQREMYLKREGLLDMTDSAALDHYLGDDWTARRRRVVAWRCPAVVHRGGVLVRRESAARGPAQAQSQDRYCIKCPGGTVGGGGDRPAADQLGLLNTARPSGVAAAVRVRMTASDPIELS